MIFSILLLILGFVILIKGADFFVDGASSLAENFKIPKVVIALTIVAFGTSAPELAVSTKAILSGSSEIVLGNVVGSNILNILLILGTASLFAPLSVKRNTIKKELPFVILFSMVLMILCFDNIFDKNIINVISRNDGIILLLFFSIFVHYLITTMIKSKEHEEINEEKPKYNVLISILITILGLGGIILGSDFVVDNAIDIAKALNVSEKMISLTIIAFGTSLPELVTSVQAARKGENEIAIGNVIGSNIFNIGVVIGVPCALFNNVAVGSFNYIDMLVMILSSVLLLLLVFKKRKISKVEGIIMLFIFAFYYSYVVIGGLR